MPACRDAGDGCRPRADTVVEDDGLGIGIGSDDPLEEGDGLLGWMEETLLPSAICLAGELEDARRIPAPRVICSNGFRLSIDPGGLSPSCPALVGAAGGELGMVYRKSGIEDQDGFMAPKRHSIRVQEPDGSRLVPDEVVAEPRATGVDEVGGEGLGSREDDGASRSEEALILLEERANRKTLVPSAVRYAIGQVAEDEIDARGRQPRHDLHAVATGYPIDVGA